MLYRTGTEINETLFTGMQNALLEAGRADNEDQQGGFKDQ